MKVIIGSSYQTTADYRLKIILLFTEAFQTLLLNNYLFNLTKVFSTKAYKINTGS